MGPTGTLRLIAESQDYVRGGTQKDTYSPDEVMEVRCPLCASEDRERLYTEHGAIGISRCSVCSLIYTSPRLGMAGRTDRHQAVVMPMLRSVGSKAA